MVTFPVKIQEQKIVSLPIITPNNNAIAPAAAVRQFLSVRLNPEVDFSLKI